MYVVTPSQMRQIDQRAIEEFHIPGIVLMENAALRTVQVIQKHYPNPTNVLILAGCGNNGGDALAVARHLVLAGYQTSVVIASEDGRRPRGDAETNLKILKSLEAHQTTLRIHESQLKEFTLARVLTLIREANLIIDGLFGTGLDRQVTGLYADLIDAVNKQSGNTPVISIDIPSGINGKDGQIMGTAIRATHTVAYGYLKTGHLLYPGREYAGEVHVVPISLPQDSIQMIHPVSASPSDSIQKIRATASGASDSIQKIHAATAGPSDSIQKIHAAPVDPSDSSTSVKVSQFTLTDAEAAQLLKPRPRNSHKGTYGKVAVIAGSVGLTGAAYLTSMGAQRSGAGLVTLGIPASLNPIMEQKLTEIMTLPIEDRGQGQLVTESLRDVTSLLEDKDVLAIGPGCGKSLGVFETLWNILGRIHISLVIDADGLNQISKDMSLIKKHTAPVILTPHPGELSRMTGLEVSDIAKLPVEAATEAANQFGCIVLLKGATSVVAEPLGRVYLNTSGNPGMAKGGSGDVLTGMIAALVAQGYPPYEAAVLGCYIHGRAGDEAAGRIGETGMLAGDLLESIPAVFKRLHAIR